MDVLHGAVELLVLQDDRCVQRCFSCDRADLHLLKRQQSVVHSHVHDVCLFIQPRDQLSHVCFKRIRQITEVL